MATRKVLGNDPFTRGAPPREPVAQRPPPPRAKGKPASRLAPRPPTPELQTTAPRPWGDGPIQHPDAPSATPLPGPGRRAHGPRPHANTPSTPAADPVAHAATPSSEPLEREPVAHPNSPREVSPSAPPRQVPTLASLPPQSSLPAAALGMLKAAGAALGLGAPGREVDDWGKDLSLSRSLRPVADLLFERYWRVQTSGLEHVPAGPCVIVANHAGALPLDGPLLHLALRKGRPELHDARWLLEDQLFFAPLVGGLANRLGAVRATPENAHRLLDEGRPLIVFPEGLPGLSRSFAERHRLSRFGRGGYLKVALRAGVPVVPVALLGGGESTPLLARLPGGAFGFEYLPLTPPPLPARWFVRFGAPVSLDGLPADPDGDPVAIEARNLEVRDAVQALLDALVSERKGVFS